jgi:hypothetical protein
MTDSPGMIRAAATIRSAADRSTRKFWPHRFRGVKGELIAPILRVPAEPVNVAHRRRKGVQASPNSLNFKEKGWHLGCENQGSSFTHFAKMRSAAWNSR